MITLLRTAVIAPGKVSSSVAFAKEAAAHITATTGTDVSIALPVGGNPNRIAWTIEFKTLADFDAMMLTLMTDPGYADLLAKNSDNFIAGSVHDEIWRGI